MTQKTIAPYGTWTSPVTPRMMTEGAIGLSGLAVDGETLYWLESRPGEAGRTCLCRRSADGTIADVTPVPIDVGSRVHEYGGGAYAVSGGTIIFSERRDGSLWLIEGLGKGVAAPRRLVTLEKCRYADFEFDFVHRRVLAVCEDHRDRPPTNPKASIVALPLDGGEATVLVAGPDFLSSPRRSPDGKALAWIAWDHPNMPWDATRLYRADIAADGTLGGTQLIAGEMDEAIVQPRFAADGSLYFASDRTGWWNLYVARPDHIAAVAPIEAEIGGPHWVFGQRAYHLFDDGRILAAVVSNGLRTVAMIVQGRYEKLDLDQVLDCPLPLGDGLAMICTPTHAPPSISLQPSGATAAIMLRASTPPVLPEDAISIGAPLSFPTQDTFGHAFWYPPKNRDCVAPEGELPPLVVLSHGGPTSMTTNGFGLRIQWWTTRGFAVVDVNYGGSTGFGRAYRRRLDGQWGIVDVADSVAAASYLAERGLVDRNRIVIRGGSAGGFTTLAALTSSDVFKAGASLYGVADLLLLARDTHKFESRYLDRLIGPLPQAEALYRDRSPINHIDRLSCPIIFFQGLEDKTVPPNQAELMVAAMAARNLPVAYYAFEGEGHGFRMAETLKRVLELELDFYGRVFGFTAPDLSERVVVRNETERQS